MICKTCANKSFCKYYECIKDMPITISECEVYREKHKIIPFITPKPIERKPIEYNVDNSNEEDYNEEEPIVVDLEYIKKQEAKEPISLFEMLTEGGEEENGEE